MSTDIQPESEFPHNAQAHAAEPGEPVPGLIDLIEGFAGVFTGTLLAVGVALSPLMVFPFALQRLDDGALVLSTFVSTVIFEGRYVWRLWATLLQGELPLGPAVAKRSSSRRRWLGPFAAFWWFGHFLASVFSIVVITSLGKSGDLIGTMISAFMAVGVGIGGNVYLALMIQALTADEAVVMRWWRHRFLLDAVVAAFAITFAAMMP